MLASGIVLAGCPSGVPTPAEIYELTDSGVVESVEELEDGGWRVSTEGGDLIELGAGAIGLDSEAIPKGDLLIVGSTGPSIAYLTLWQYNECYVLDEPATDDGRHILFDIGLRLPKSPRFDPGPIDDGRYPSFREGFCINAAGEVVSYGS